MKYWLLPVTCVLLLLNISVAQDTLWTRRFNTGSDEVASGIAYQENNIVVVGSRLRTINHDWLIVKYNQLGDTIWTRTYVSDFEDLPADASFDSANNILVTGYEYLNKKSNNLYYKIFGKMPDLFKFPPNQDDTLFSLTVKFDSLGSIKWKRTESNKQAIGITVDNDCNSYVSGSAFNGYGYDFWLVKYNPQGETIWTRTIDFSLLDIGYRITTDAEGNIIQSGLSGDGYSFDCYVIKYLPNGDTIWTRRFDLNTMDYGIAVATDPENNIIVVGLTGSDPYYDFLVIKYNTEGTLVWSKTFDRNSMDEAIGVACDSNNNIFVTGVSGENSIYDYLTIKYNPAGDTIWTATYDNGDDDVAQDIACDNAGNPIVTGGSVGVNGYDFLTIKYRGGTGIEEPRFTQNALRNTPVLSHSSIRGSNIIFYAPFSGCFNLELYDCNGRQQKKIYNGYLIQGAHQFSLKDLGSGVQFIRVKFPDGNSAVQKLVLIK